MILARHAEALFWTGRQIERAEATARVVDVATRNRMHVHDVSTEAEWRFLITMLGLDEYFEETDSVVTPETVMNFLFMHASNPGSVVASIAALRENLRIVRDRVPVELWEEANRLYLALSPGFDPELLDGEPSEVFATVRRGCQAMSGVVSEAMPRDEGHTFIVVGRMLERSTMTVRMLRQIWAAADKPDDAATVLRMTSSLQAFRRLYGYDEDLRSLTVFLLQAEGVPRSVLSCLRRAESRFDGLVGAVGGLGAGRKLCGRLRAELEFGTFEEILGENPVKGLDRLLRDLAYLANVIADHSFDPAQAKSLHAQFVRPGLHG